MRIALAQIASTVEPERNLELVAERVRAAAAAGARLVVFPEATMCCFGVKLGPVAEPLDGPWATRVREVAAAAGVTVVVGMFTPADDGRVHNTLLATGGGVEAGYDKIHLFDAFGFAESDTVAPGTEPVTIEVDGATVGLATCYDLRFPGLFQLLGDRGRRAGRGARLVGRRSGQARAVGPAGPGPRAGLDDLRGRLRPGRPDHGRAGIRAGRRPGSGPARWPARWGRSSTSSAPEPGLLLVDIDLGEVDAARKVVPVLANRRF